MTPEDRMVAKTALFRRVEVLLEQAIRAVEGSEICDNDIDQLYAMLGSSMNVITDSLPK